jgi:sigma-E factor negative regulatory protein RseA
MTVENRIEESLSALMDGEAEELELRRVLKEIPDSSALRETWHRYQLASSAMKRDLPPRFTDLSSQISAALDDEPSHRNQFSTLYQTLGKVAIAASVAVVSVLGVQQLQQTGVGAPEGINPAPAVAVQSDTPTGDAQFQLPAGFDLPPVSARTVSAGFQPKPTVLVTARPVGSAIDEEAVREYFNAQMERHTQNAARASSSQGVMPFARLPQGSDNSP